MLKGNYDILLSVNSHNKFFQDKSDFCMLRILGTWRATDITAHDEMSHRENCLLGADGFIKQY